MLDAIADGGLSGAVAHVARAYALVAISAVLDPLALLGLTRAAIFNSLAALLHRLTGDRMAFRFQHRALSFQALATTEIAIAALLFALAADLLTLTFDLLPDAARFLGIAGALDRFTCATLTARLCTRLRRKNQDRKS